MTQKPLSGFKLVTLALDVPGPVAAARLVELGMKAIKVEPPAGDALKSAARHLRLPLHALQGKMRLAVHARRGSEQES